MTSLVDPNISCHEAVRWVWDYLDGEVGTERARVIREHLDGCENCRKHFNFEGAFLRTISRLIDDGVTDADLLRSRIVRALEGQGYVDVDSRSR